jgi:predicted RNA-binding Zn ribbon-like protein
MLRRLAGHPVLDFVNTIDPREGDERVDYLATYADLVEWARRGGIVSKDEARSMALSARHRPATAARAFTRAIRLREAAYAVFAAIAARRSVSGDELHALESAYRDAAPHAALVRRASRFQWQLPRDLDLVRWRIARAAVALLESNDLARVKQCPGSADCGWLFLDHSKNASRRWCSMEGCGNRAKIRRFLTRQRRARSRRRVV